MLLRFAMTLEEWTIVGWAWGKAGMLERSGKKAPYFGGEVYKEFP